MSLEDNQYLFRKSLELDFPEIDEKQNDETPSELRYQIKNVLSVLKETIGKLKISLILPKLLENPKILQQYLQNTKYSQGLELVKEYRKKTKAETQTEPNQKDYETLKIIDYFQANHQMLNVFPNWLDDIDDTEKYLLQAFDDVCEIAEERFQRPAITDLAQEKRLHVIYLANEETVQKIRDIKHKIQKKNLNLLWKNVAKSGVLQKLEDELALNQNENNLFVKREMLKSQREIERANNAFVAKQQELEEELKKARLNYEATLKKNLSQEKSIQDERNKIQLQLQALIKKYDQTIYDKHKEEILLQKEHEKQKQEFQEFLCEYRKEEAIYEEFVLKQQRLQEAKVLLFTYGRAAIKIQKWWKAVQKKIAKKAKENAKLEKKKNKKAQKGKSASEQKVKKMNKIGNKGKKK